METYLRVPEITKKLGLDRTTIWRWCRDGLCPRPVKLGKQAIGWPTSIAALCATCVRTPA